MADDLPPCPWCQSAPIEDHVNYATRIYCPNADCLVEPLVAAATTGDARTLWRAVAAIEITP